MADETVQTQVVREAPEIEAYKRALLESSLAQVNAINQAAAQGRYLTPGYQIAGMSQNQLDAIAAGQAGIGAYQPYLTSATRQLMSGTGTTQQAIDALKAADTRGDFNAAQYLTDIAGAGTMRQASPIGQQQIQQYMNPYQNLVLQQQLDEMGRQAQIQQQQLQGQATRAGAFGGSREGIMRSELARNLMQTQNQAIAQSMQQNYAQGLQAAQQQQQAALGAYGQLGNLAQGIGSLAGQRFGIGAQIAQGLGGFGAQQAALGSQAAALGQQAQALGQQDVNFLYNLGAQQQRQQQALLDAQRQNQLQQNMQPIQMLGFLSDIYKGAPSTQMGMTQMSAPTASPFQQIAGLGVAGLSAAAAGAKAGLF